jgi:hypothetical protein
MVSTQGTSATDPRPLTEPEREIVNFMLSPEAPGIAELREQSDTALARQWECGCASFDLVVGKEQTSPSTGRWGEIMGGRTRSTWHPRNLSGVMLWVDDDGWLSSLEVVDVAEKHGEFNFLPPPSMCEAPTVGEAPTAAT